MQKPSFRHDVQALRGVAVLLVMLFHANKSWVPGGFLGVDIFFTISGFVIFRLIHHELTGTGRFSFSSFYKRRVIRLFPALFATIAITLLLSAKLLPADQMQDVLDSALWSILSVANIYFYLDSGYFAAEAIEKPLLHLWSLGVEEQFYIAFPLLAVLIAPLTTRLKIGVFLLLTLTGAMLSQHYVQTNPSAAFYLPAQRVFQFTIGAMVALLPSPAISPRTGMALWSVVLAGLCLTCVFLVSEATPLPGWRGLMIAAAVACLLYLGETSAGGINYLKHPAVQFFGNASYSLYLAHWPVAVVLMYHFGEKSPSLVSPAIFMVGLLAGTLLYFGVEKPLRKFSVRQVLLFPVSVSVLLVITGYYLHEPAKTRHTPFEAVDPALAARLQGLAPLLVTGDSHAHSLMPVVRTAIDEPARRRGKIVLGCPPLTDVYKVFVRKKRGTQERIEKCAASQQSRLQLVQSMNPATVVLAARWELYHTDQVAGYTQPWLDGLVTDLSATPSISRQENLRLLEIGLVNTIHQLGARRVVLIGPNPLHKTAAFRCAKRLLEKGQQDDARINSRCKASESALARQNYASLDALFRNLEQRFDNVTYISPVQLLCEAERCELVRGGELLYKDGDHLSDAGALIILDRLSRDASRLTQ